jgi:hypothetical protein
MKLTSDYRRVTALFNTPLEEEIEYGQYGESLRTDFEVGPFVYAINFSPEDDSPSTIYVEFELIDMDVSDEELVRMMSKVKRQQIEEKAKKKEISSEEEAILKGRLLSLKEAKDQERLVINAYSHSELEIMGSYVIKIFSTVIGIIRDYVKSIERDALFLVRYLRIGQEFINE